MDDEEFDRRWQYRQRMWENIMIEQFQLSYLANYDYLSLEMMAPHERKFFHDLLLKTKQEERDAIENS